MSETKSVKPFKTKLDSKSQDALKKSWKAKIQDDDDDESGGGAGKRHQGTFSKSKLMNLIRAGKKSAEPFASFLRQDFLDEHETAKSEVAADFEDSAAARSEVNKESSKQQQERVSSYLSHENATSTDARTGKSNDAGRPGSVSFLNETVAAIEKGQTVIQNASSVSVFSERRRDSGRSGVEGRGFYGNAFGNSWGFTAQGMHSGSLEFHGGARGGGVLSNVKARNQTANTQTASSGETPTLTLNRKR